MLCTWVAGGLEGDAENVPQRGPQRGLGVFMKAERLYFRGVLVKMEGLLKVNFKREIR